MAAAAAGRFARFLLIVLAIQLSALPGWTQSSSFFEVEEFDPGLGETPDAIDRSTPRSAMVSFLQAGEAGRWDAAAHVLDLSEFPPAEQPARGAALAERLHAIIERKALLDWTLLNDRPDGLQASASQEAPQAGEPRRSLLLRELPANIAPAAIRLNRVKPGDADPIWVFPPETVANIPALYRRYGPSRFEQALPEPLRMQAFWGLMWWELLGLPLLAIAAMGLAAFLHRTLQAIGHRLTNPLATSILRATRMPTIFAVVTMLVWFVTHRVFVFSGNIDVFVTPLIAIGFVTALLMLIVNVVEALLDALITPGVDVDLTKEEEAEKRTLATRINAGKRIMVVVVFLVGVGIVLSTARVFQGIGISFLASAGAFTVLLGFAARNVLGNILASLQIALNQSARVGDRVVYKGELCHVERIHLTYVQLRDWDGTRLVVPVAEFISETFSNWSLQDPAMLRILQLKLDPRADVEELRRAFHDILRDLSNGELGAELGDLGEAVVNVAGQDVFGIDVWFSTPCKDPNTSWEVACTVRERLVARAAEIERDGDRPVFPATVPAQAA
ncbi:mechanosensitive ion channel domain-containing protein [uncultured Jannaschia sp.]|uniref:mechanosensitive ion channel family protein n=1 Tax=uncultured Jannaschia sp. TaxID=293347 RepID=UPI00260D01BA|nr:mechanosensitive ion channel domain-containing protein [uncultured Jannaschia sp.]